MKNKASQLPIKFQKDKKILVTKDRIMLLTTRIATTSNDNVEVIVYDINITN